MPGYKTVLLILLIPTGPSCTLPKYPTPCPVPCKYYFPIFHKYFLANISISIPVNFIFFGHFNLYIYKFPNNTRVYESFYSRVGYPKWNTLVTSVVPFKYCPPESTKCIIFFDIVELFYFVAW